MSLPDKPGWWWWASSRGPEAEAIPVYLFDPGDLAPERSVLEWFVCYPAEHRHLKENPLIPHAGSRTVRNMGGVWLGPCKPPKPARGKE